VLGGVGGPGTTASAVCATAVIQYADRTAAATGQQALPTLATREPHSRKAHWAVWHGRWTSPVQYQAGQEHLHSTLPDDPTKVLLPGTTRQIVLDGAEESDRAE